MTDKEKAEAYDKAIMVAKNCLERGTNPANNPLDYFIDCICKMFPDSFPELRESEDERILNEIIETIETTRVEALRDFPNCSVLQESYWTMLRWLKSLKNRENFLKSNINSTSWKPSKEQMKAVICAIEECGYNSGLESLYNDLKKL